MSRPVSNVTRRWGWWCAVTATVGLLALLAVGMTRDPHELPAMRLGKPWPAMALPRLGGGMAVDPAGWRGQARLVNLWASWCATCREEHPALLQLAATLKAEGRSAQLIGLNYKDAPEQAQAWLGRLGDPFSVSMVDGDGRLAIELGVYGAPESFIVDASGIVVWKHVGALTPELMAREVLPRLRGAAS